MFVPTKASEKGVPNVSLCRRFRRLGVQTYNHSSLLLPAKYKTNERKRLPSLPTHFLSSLSPLFHPVRLFPCLSLSPLSLLPPHLFVKASQLRSPPQPFSQRHPNSLTAPRTRERSSAGQSCPRRARSREGAPEARKRPQPQRSSRMRAPHPAC